MDQEESKIPHIDHELLWVSDYGGMSDHVFSVSNVKYTSKGKPLREKNATGFFFEHKGKLYFITNRHVIIDKDFHPDNLVLNLHIDKINLKNTSRICKVPLYDGVEPKWLEHPNTAMDIDIVALPVELPPTFHVTSFNERDCILGEYPNSQSIHVPVGDDLLVVGYPEGFYDSVHNTPIIRRGSLASVYPLWYQDKPQFLIDALLHDGTSGSPVLLKASRLIRTNTGARQCTEYPSKRYLYVFSSNLFLGFPPHQK